MPDVIVGGYIRDAFIECGVVSGEGPITLTEIDAYCTLIRPLASDEVKTIRSMSNAYLAGLKLGKDPFGVAPFEG